MRWILKPDFLLDFIKGYQSKQGEKKINIHRFVGVLSVTENPAPAICFPFTSKATHNFVLVCDIAFR